MKYLLFDVFAEAPFQGNQLAVFTLEKPCDTETMQRIANEMNLAESIFLTRTGDDRVPAKARIFTPGREMKFAGHPTVGATVAIADVLQWIPRDVTEFAINEPIGDVPVRVERNGTTTAWLRTPPVTLERTFERTQAAAALSLPADAVRRDLPVQAAGAGNPFLFIPLADKASVDAAELDPAAARPLMDGCVGVYFFALTAEGTYARMLAPMSGIAEDPATGSATGVGYTYLLAHGAIPKAQGSYVSEQGVKMGRRSVLHVRIEVYGGGSAAVHVGGRAIHIGSGELTF
jgi:trans-2,3-dihydro-3-hydroxyanthranilate isomerase